MTFRVGGYTIYQLFFSINEGDYFMNEKLILSLDLINCKLGYILASLASFTSLDLSKGINEINQHIELISQSIKDDKEYVDIRNVINLRENLKKLKTRLNNEDKVSLKGHRIACLLFEVATLLKLAILDFDESYEDMIEYLSLSSEYCYFSGRIVNIEILCFEEKR
jgi:hypothetical protein